MPQHGAPDPITEAQPDRLPDPLPRWMPTQIDLGGSVLRAPRHDDAPALIKACQDPEIPRWTTVPSPYGQPEADAFIARELHRRANDDRCYVYVLADAEDRLLGTVGLVRNHPDDLVGEVGYWLAPWGRGAGHLRAALPAVVRAMLHAGYERIEARVLVGNEPSQRALEHAGFTHEGTLRSLAGHGCGGAQQRIDLHLYSMVRQDEAALALLQ